MNYEQYVITNQDGINKDARSRASGTPAPAGATPTWSRSSNGLANWGGRYPDRFNMQASVSYVTGAHNFKAGVPVQLGPLREHARDQRRPAAGLRERRAVTTVTRLQHAAALQGRRCSPTSASTLQDSWTLNRLTLNGGLRWEYPRHEVSEQASGAGRFVGERNFDAIPMPTWKDLAPRFGVVYDLFGNAKTALKFGLNRYNESRTTSVRHHLQPAGARPRSLSWTDLNGDDIAQGELGCTYLTRPAARSTSRSCRPTSAARPLNRVDPDFKRIYNIETTAGIQHELLPRVSVSANWYRRTFHRPAGHRQPAAHDGRLHAGRRLQPDRPASRSRVYNLTPAAAEPRRQLRHQRRRRSQAVYNGVDFNLQRPAARRRHALRRVRDGAQRCACICDEPDDPNLLLYCDDGENDIPSRTQFKFAGTYPLGWGIQASAVVPEPGRPTDRRLHRHRHRRSQQHPRPRLRRRRQPDRHALADHAHHALPGQLPGAVPAGRVGRSRHDRSQLTIPLKPGGQELLDRINQLDVSFAKWFELGAGRRVQLQADIFNIITPTRCSAGVR